MYQSSRSTSSVGTSASKTAKDQTAKPIKLRAACNNCFSAKVRCEGNKQGCQRCVEKRLSCVYSESRVGKVVGRRRKRPLDESIGTVTSEAWIVNPSQHPFVRSLPSPAATATTSTYSDCSNKRHFSEASWTSFLVDDHPDFAQVDEPSEAFHGIDMSDKSTYLSSEYGFRETSYGLPTPSLSPPQFAYCTPAALEAQPLSRPPSVSSISSHASSLAPPQYPTSFSQSSDPFHPEDEEVVCIKLLAHLKKASGESRRRADQVELLQKSNAVIRRILSSKNARSDYSVHLLLSAILTHVVSICELVSTQPSEQILQPRDRHFEDQMNTSRNGGLDAAQLAVAETSDLAIELSNLLKRQPLNGFQTLGRHECHHVELDLRIQRVLMKLDA